MSFPPTYPKTFPRLKLSFDEDVRPNTRKLAQDIIETKPKTLDPGTEIIYEVTILLQEVLDNASKRNSKDMPNLDEERTLRENLLSKAREDEINRNLKASEADDGNVSEEEQRLLEELVEQERSRSERRKLSKISSTTMQPDINPDIAGAVQFDQSAIVKDRSGKVLNFRLVQDKAFYREGPVATLFTVQVRQRPDSSGIKESASPAQLPFLVLKEYFIPSVGPDDKVKKDIQNLEMQLDRQTHGQTPHPSILKPINYLILRCDLSEGDDSTPGWRISVLTELAYKGSLADLLEMAGQLSDTKKIRAWALQILEGLHHYHRHGSAHGGIHLNNILLEYGEAKNIVVKLSDGVYGCKLRLLKGRSSNDLPPSWKAPEDMVDHIEVSAASDIWYFGICLLQIGFGNDVVDQYRSPAALLNDLGLSTSFKALLRQLFDKSPKKRPSAWDALHFEFFRNDDTLFEHQDHNLEAKRSSAAVLSLSVNRHRRRESASVSASSRYAKEFVEDGKLGRGGYGEVFRARNRIDGQLYAIKKIKARSKAALDPVLSEASVLSRLNHPNVVRYYASWIDDAATIENGNENETESSIEVPSSSLDQYAAGPIFSQSSRVMQSFSRIVQERFRILEDHRDDC